MKAITSLRNLAVLAACAALFAVAPVANTARAAQGPPRSTPKAETAVRIVVDTPSDQVESVFRVDPSTGTNTIRIRRAGQADHVYALDVSRGTVTATVGAKTLLTVVYPNATHEHALVITPGRTLSFADLVADESLYAQAWSVRLRARLADDMRVLRALRSAMPQTIMAEHAFMLSTRDDSIIAGAVPARYAIAPGQELPVTTAGFWSCYTNCVFWGHQSDVCFLGCGAQNPN